MNANLLKKGQNLLVLRYSLKLKNDIIDQHIKIVDQQGYCWYGKIVGVTSNKIIHAIMKTDHPALLLYCKGNAYLCELETITTEKPDGGYPKYYDDEYIYPSCYFKLKSINSVSLDILHHLIIRRSGRLLSDVFSGQCMASTFFAAYDEVVELPRVEGEVHNKKKQSQNKSGCVYQIEGKCTLSGFINYKYDYDRPSACARQKQ